MIVVVVCRSMQEVEVTPLGSHPLCATPWVPSSAFWTVYRDLQELLQELQGAPCRPFAASI